MKNAHSGAVVLVVVCSATRDVVSVGIDRRVAVHREKPNALSLVLTGGIEETHRTAITACAVSQEAQLIATAAGDEIRLWNKQVIASSQCPLDHPRGLVFKNRTYMTRAFLVIYTSVCTACTCRQAESVMPDEAE